MTLDLSDRLQRNISWGQYEPHGTEIVKTYLRPGGTFVDVGANIGYYTALAGSIVGVTGRVVSFEPDPQCFRVLTKNFGTVKYIECINLAISDSVDSLKLYIPPDSEHNRDSSCVEYCEDMTAFECKTTMLDIALDKCDHIQLLKMDIEGHEPRAVLGGQHVFESGRVERVLCELNERLLLLAGSSQAELIAMFQACGFILDKRIGRDDFANALFRHSSVR
jgi:FkbM family methyltransferase